MKRSHITCLQHVPFEGPAAIADWAARRGHAMSITRLFEQAPLPKASDIDWLLVMGGPMGVHDEDQHPWLAAEKRFIAECIAAGKRVVGVCLGAQLIADALGARVYRHEQPEIGWFPISLTEAGRSAPRLAHWPSTLDVFHWHGDTFELPAGAVHLARSANCEHQIFLHGDRVLGLQCHLEVTPESVRDILVHCADEIRPGPCVQSAEQIARTGARDLGAIHDALFDLLDRLG